jgi:hypothetical protein
MTISELLQTAREEHTRYRGAIPHMRPDRIAGKLMTISGDATVARNHLVTAYGARLEAEQRDPGHADAGWATDHLAGFPHYALLQFYETELIPQPLPDGAPTAA